MNSLLQTEIKYVHYSATVVSKFGDYRNSDSISSDSKSSDYSTRILRVTVNWVSILRGPNIIESKLSD